MLAADSMATKECKRQARELVEALEVRVHGGSPVRDNEIQSAREFLRQNDFSTSSDYFNRLGRIQNQVAARPVTAPRGKRNYGGEAAGRWMQLQSVYDHVILSTCYQGEFNTQRGRIKISHRFNQSGRIDFVELKFLRSLQPCLDGAIRKLLLIKEYQSLQTDWLEADAFALRVLPQELVFVNERVFRYSKEEILAWLVNIGHWAVQSLLAELRAHRVNGCLRGEVRSDQLCLKEVASDEVAVPILERAATLEAAVEIDFAESLIVRYLQN